MPQLKQVELKAADKGRHNTTQHNNKSPKPKRGEENYFVMMMASKLLNAEGPSWKLVLAGHISGDTAFILS